MPSIRREAAENEVGFRTDGTKLSLQMCFQPLTIKAQGEISLHINETSGEHHQMKRTPLIN